MRSVFDLYSARYDEWFDKNNVIYLTELKALRKAIPLGDRGLEVGVGTGRFASPLDISIGIDPSLEMLNIAKKRGVNVVLGEGEVLPFKNKKFDYTLIMVTLCFVKNAIEVMRESKRVLKNGGKIIVGIIDKNSSLGRFYHQKNSPFYKVAKFYTTKECIKLLEKNEFNNIIAYQTIFRSPSKMRKIEEIKEGYGEGSFVVINGSK